MAARFGGVVRNIITEIDSQLAIELITWTITRIEDCKTLERELQADIAWREQSCGYDDKSGHQPRWRKYCGDCAAGKNHSW